MVPFMSVVNNLVIFSVNQGSIISDDCTSYILRMITCDVRTVSEAVNALNKYYWNRIRVLICHLFKKNYIHYKLFFILLTKYLLFLYRISL